MVMRKTVCFFWATRLKVCTLTDGMKSVRQINRVALNAQYKTRVIMIRPSGVRTPAQSGY